MKLKEKHREKNKGWTRFKEQSRS